MGHDCPGVRERIPRGLERRARQDQRTRLLALAGALDDIGLRARIIEYVLRPSELRFWNPDEMGRTLTVVCVRTGTKGRWQFRLHPDGAVVTDAVAVTQPDRALSTARALATVLEKG